MSKKMSKSHRKWTYQEVQYLKEHWGEYSQVYFAKKFNRSPYAIRIKAHKLGLMRMIHCGEYITYNQLINLIHNCDNYGGFYDKKLLKSGFPLDYQTITKQKVKIVYMHKFWNWFEKNKHLINLSKTTSETFGYEPAWVAEKRKADKLAAEYKKTPWTKSEDNRLISLLNSYKYGYREISKMLKRTEGALKRRMIDLKIPQRPLRADNHTPWSESEINKVKDLYLKGYQSCVIAEYINRSALAINGLLERHNYFKEVKNEYKTNKTENNKKFEL